MKGSRAEWLILAALLVVLVGASILVGAQGESEGPELAPDPSTYNARGSGSKGLFVWLQELGVNVRRWERPLEDLPEEARVLLVLGPRRLLDGGELAAVERWVRAGGVLCLADSAVGRAVPGVLPGPAALKFGLRPRFAEEIISELRKVTWPTREDVVHLTVVVVIITLILGAVLGAIDIGFGWLIDNTLLR